jgi:hypothetical protein
MVAVPGVGDAHVQLAGQDLGTRDGEVEVVAF